MLTQERLKELFLYDPVIGFFTNRTSRGRAKEGNRAGSPTGHGYRRIIIDYQKHYEHHLAFIYLTGKLPLEVDHKDGNRSNNSFANLRSVTRSENCFNAKRDTGTSGLKGAYLITGSTRWYSKIQLGGQVKFLGNFDTAREAHQAFMAAVTLYHGEFAYHNRPLIRRI